MMDGHYIRPMMCNECYGPDYRMRQALKLLVVGTVVIKLNRARKNREAMLMGPSSSDFRVLDWNGMVVLVRKPGGNH